MRNATLRARRSLTAALTGLALTAPGLAWGQDLELTIDQDVADAFGIDVSQMETELEAQTSEALNLVDPQAFMDSMANAGGIAAKGMGVDYASNPKMFVVGGGVGASTHAGGFSFGRGDEELPENGFATMVSLMAGVNLGLFNGPGDDGALDRFVVYVNGMALDLPSDREFGGSMNNVGAHVQAKLVKGKNAKVVEWGGLDLTTGFEHSTYVLALSDELPITGSVPVDGSARDAEVTWTAEGTYDMKASTNSIPLEVSTNVRALILSLYFGGAVDVHLAKSVATAELDGPLEARLRGTKDTLGTAKLTVDFDGAGDPFVPRGFVGTQLNLTVLKLYAHLNAGANGTLGGHMGVRVAM